MWPPLGAKIISLLLKPQTLFPALTHYGPAKMSTTTDSFVIKTIHWWEKNILNRPWLLIVVFLVASGLIGKYTMDNLTVNTNTADMISIQLPFQQNRIKLEKSFPQDIGGCGSRV